MSHRMGGTNRYTKHSTGGNGRDSSGGGGDHVEVTNFKAPPPYLKGKVKSISETDLGRPMRKTILAKRTTDKNDFAQNHRAHTPDQASVSPWNSLLPATTTDNTAADSPQIDTHQSEDYSKLVLEKPLRNKQAAITRNKNNNKGMDPPSHKMRWVYEPLVVLMNIYIIYPVKRERETCSVVRQAWGTYYVRTYLGEETPGEAFK